MRRKLFSFALLAMLLSFASPALAQVAKIGDTEYATIDDAVAAAQNGGTIILIADVVELTAQVVIPEGKVLTLDLNGKTVNSVFNGTSTTNHIYALSNKGTLTIQDSKGNGSINSRGIYNYGSLTLNAGAINAIDGNGGYAVNNQSGSTFVMNGGVVAATNEDDHQSSSGGYDATALKVPAGCTATLNGGTINDVCDFTFAIDAAGTLNIPATSTITVNGTHGAIYVSGGETTINAGTFQIPADEYSRTDNVLYVSGGSLVVNGGTFIGDSDTASGGSCLWDEAGKAVVNGGTFKGSSGGDVWGTTGTTIKGGTFENLKETSHVAVGATITNGGKTYTKSESGNMEEIACAAMIGTTPYETLAEAVAAAQEGETITLIGNVVLAERVTIPADKTLTIDLNGKSISMEESIIATAYAINNLGTLTIQDTKGNGSINARGIYNGYGDGAANVATAKITVLSGTINAKGTNGGGAAIFNYGVADIQGGTFTSVASYAIALQTGSTMTIGENAIITGGINSWQSTLTITGGTISNDKSGKHVVYAGESAVTINGGTFHNNNSGNATIMASGSTAAVEITGGTFTLNIVDASSSYLIDATSSATYTISGGSFTGGIRAQGGTKYEITGGTFTNEYGNYNVYEGGDINISGGTFTGSYAQKFATDNLAAGYELGADGKIVLAAKPVAQIGTAKYTSLQAALNDAAAGTGNVTVDILNNIDLTGENWTPVTVSGPGYPLVTVEGNNKTITGLNDMLFAATWAGKSGLIIKNLTIENSTIVNDKDDAKGDVGVGAFIGYPEASATITLENCHLKNSSVEGGHWTGGLIGMAGGYNGTDGPVFMNLTIKDCSVTGSTITGKGSVGGIIGHGSCSAWTNVVIEGATISDNTITSTGSSNVKAGAVMGTIGAAGQPTTTNGETKTGGTSVSATVVDNIVTSNGTTITTIYGRQGTETGMLYIAGGSYDNNPIEEGVAYAAPVEGYKIVENADGTYGIAEASLAGEGTEANPYLISSVDDLILFRNSVNAGESKYNAPGVWVTLDTDINLDGENWTPIGNITYNSKYEPADPTKVFCGVFNGNGKTISNLKATSTVGGVDEDANVGLFGITGAGAVIKDLTLTNVNIETDGRNVGALAGFAYKATLSNITVNGNIQIKGGNNVSGVAGMTRYYAMSATNISVIGNDGSAIVGNNIVGGIFAEIAPNGSEQKFDGLNVENIAITGVGGVGGVVGLLTQGAVENVSVKNVVLTGRTDYQGNAMGRIRLGSVSGLMGGSYAIIADETIENVTAKNLDGNAVELPVIGANYDAATNATEAKIGDTYYKSLSAAVNAAKDNEKIILIADVKTTDGIIITNKNLTIDLNGKTYTVTEGASTNNRNFKINGTSVVTVKNGTMVAAGEYSSGAYGTIRTEGSANVNLTGLKLYNYRGNGLNIKACAGTTVTIENTEIYANYGGGIESAGGTIVVNNGVTVEQKGMYTAPYNSMAISVNGGGKVTVNGGTFSTECITAEEANNQGTSHGPWVAGVLNSGGTLIINGGTFSNDNFGGNSLATAARGAILADTKAKVEIYGGTFNVLKNVIDIQNNLGDANNNPSVLLVGGTYSADPRISAQYGSNLITLAEGYQVVENNGVWTVAEAGLAGEGTEANPYLISSIDDLILFRNSVNEGVANKYNASGVWVALGADIDLAGENWIGIGSAYKDHGFMGNFDGKNFKIKNLTIDNPALDSDGYVYAGLFGVTEGTDQNNQNTIKNLTIENVTINTTGHIVSAAIAYPYCTIVDNVKVCGNIDITGGDYTAGALAYTRRCLNASNVKVAGAEGSTITGARVVGGVISDIQMNGGWIADYSNFSAEGVSITGTEMVGGISGIIATQTLNGASVKNVTLTSGDSRVGVISGSLGGVSTITGVTYDNVEGATAIVGPTYKGANLVEARIGDTYYATLDAALAAEGNEIELLAPITIAAGETKTLDLNGKTITGTPAEAKAYAVITNKGNLTITNGAIICNHTLAGSTGYAVNTITNGGTLTIDGATIKNISTAQYQIGYAIDNNSTTGDAIINIVAGEVAASGSLYYDGIRLFCNSETKENSVVVSGGEVSTIWMQNPSDGATKNTKDVKGSVAIEGGKVGVLSLEPSTSFKAAVTGGHINEISYFQTAEGRDLVEFVSGGTFGMDVTAFCADGFVVKANGDGTYGIAEAPAVTVPDNFGEDITNEEEKEVVSDVVNEIVENEAVNNFEPVVPAEVEKFEITLTSVEVADETSGEDTVKVTTKVTYNVEPIDADGNKVETPSDTITFRLPIPSAWSGKVRVYHAGELMGTYPIIEADGAKYVEVTSASFSEFSVEMAYREAMTIDHNAYNGSAFTNEFDVTVGTLTYTRQLNSVNTWNALYVPFEIEVTEDFLNLYTVAYFNDIHSYDEDFNGEIDRMTTEFINVQLGQTLKANYPYIIKAKSEEALTMNLSYNEATLYKAVETTISCSSVFMLFELTGNYATKTAGELAEDGKYTVWGMADSGNFATAETEDQKLNPFRIYLRASSIDGSPVKVSEAALRSISINVVGEEPTADEAEPSVENNFIYDVLGRRVLEPQKGVLYIMNGEKVIF